MLLDELLERNGHFLLDNARVVDVTRDTKELCTRVAVTAESVEPGSTATNDGGCDSDGLNVGDRGGTAKETDIGREGRLQPGLALLALERLDEGGLFTTDVSTSTSVEVDVKVVAGATGVLANVASLVGLVDGLLDVGSFLEEFSSNVNVGWSK